MALSSANVSPLESQMPAANDSAAFIARIKPDSGIAKPVYKQLLQRIIEMIESGEIADGYSLPSERTLAEALDLSRTTVRRCYEELRAQDRINTDGRAGVTVKSVTRINPKLGKLKGFTEEMQELGITASSKILEHSIINDRTIASLFNRAASARFLRLVRLRLGDGVPLSREIAWLDLTTAPALAEWDVAGSTYQFLEQHCALTLTQGEQTIEAVMSNNEETRVFGFEAPGPCLLLKRKTYTQTGAMVEYVEGTFRGDTYTYRITLK
ncbi:MAG: GntR family transcriptional regulator [Methylococcaceae bacterium]